ncbi:MAG: DUF2855 family protein [Synechococcales cyanobacterium CRU_2_2]|nr:DUF2855 family protein [Synechococcales cyanobacterium CRU_2_2]
MQPQTEHAFQINRRDLADCAWRAQPSAALAPMQVRFALQNFALSANNITYADLGESFRYWQFFPTQPGFGQLPIWGFAEVVQSEHPDFAVGQRAYGYWPLATHAVLSPAATGTQSFVDTAAHRADLAKVYQMYFRWQTPANAITEGR